MVKSFGFGGTIELRYPGRTTIRHADWKPAQPLEFRDRLNCVGQVASALSVGLAGALLCCGIGGVPAMIWGWRLAADEQTRRRVGRLRDEPSQVKQHPCRLRLVFRGQTYGMDEGLISFVEGMLLFEGSRTSFSVPRPQILRGDLGQFIFAFEFFSPVGTCVAYLRPIDKDPSGESYAAWFPMPVAPNGSIVLPPSLPCREAWQRQRTVKRLATGVALMTALATATTFVNGGAALSINLLLVGGTASLSVGLIAKYLGTALSVLSRDGAKP